MLVTKGKRNLGENCFFAIFEDENYEYTINRSGDTTEVSAKPYDPYRPYIKIVNESPAVMSFFGDTISEENLAKHIVHLEEAPEVISVMRNIAKEARQA